MGQVRWTAEAETWLREIHDFIAKDNPAAAFRTVQRIYEKADVLLDHPEIGYLYRSSTGRPIRILLFGHYRIAYLHYPVGDVEILGVFHGALDVSRYLL